MTTQAHTITRFGVVDALGLCAHYRSEAEARRNRPDAHIVAVELALNVRLAAHVERVDALITCLRMDAGGMILELCGTPADLVDIGLVPAYLFEDLGPSRNRSSMDEHGDRFEVRPRSKAPDATFWVRRYFDDAPRPPHANTRLPAGRPRRLNDIDIAPLLARFAKAGQR